MRHSAKPKAWPAAETKSSGTSKSARTSGRQSGGTTTWTAQEAYEKPSSLVVEQDRGFESKSAGIER